MKFIRTTGLLAAAALVTIMMQSVTAHASSVSYVDWTSGTPSSVPSTPGSVTGTLLIGSNLIDVTYTGDVLQFNPGDSPVNYGPSSDFTAGGTINPPPYTGMIELSQGYYGGYGPTSNLTFSNTLTFSTPVTDPIIDVVSLGWGGAQTTDYNFSATPIILSQGSDIWGGTSGDLWVVGDTLYGYEGTGAVQFDGTFSSITWSATGGEDWNGITAGAPTPEPDSLILLGSGLLGLAIVAFRKAKSAGFSMRL